MAPRDPAGWMWAEACEMLERAERLHRQFFQPAAGGRPVPTWEPPIDVVETPEEVAMIVALPGVDAAQIQVGIDDGALVVTGVRSMPPSYRSASIHRLEIPHGRFERRIPLMWERLELIRREMINGCLLLSFRKCG